MASENFSLWKPVALSPSQQWGSICWKALLKWPWIFGASQSGKRCSAFSGSFWGANATGIYIYIYLHLIFLNSSYNQDKITSWFVFPLHVYIYIYIPYIPYCQPFCLEPPEPETIHWKPGKNFFYLKLKKRWMSKWKIWRSKTGGIWEGHRASMSWGRGVEQCLPQEMHESPRSGDFYPFQRCMFDQFFQDVLLCMFWPTQLRQFQECGGWIRVKLHTRLYTGHSPPPHTHTKKNTTTTTLPKNHLFFVGGGTVCIARTFLLLAPPGVVGEECRRSEASGPCGLQSNSR